MVKGLKSLTNSKTEEEIKDLLYSSFSFLRSKIKKETIQLQSTTTTIQLLPQP
jgi:hypothetical protein